MARRTLRSRASQPCRVNITGTGTRTRSPADNSSRYRRAARTSSTAAPLLPDPAGPAITSRPDPRPPYSACRSPTWPARSSRSPAAASPGSGGNCREPTAAEAGPASGRDGVAHRTAIGSGASNPRSAAARTHWSDTAPAIRSARASRSGRLAASPACVPMRQAQPSMPAAATTTATANAPYAGQVITMLRRRHPHPVQKPGRASRDHSSHHDQHPAGDSASLYRQSARQAKTMSANKARLAAAAGRLRRTAGNE